MGNCIRSGEVSKPSAREINFSNKAKTLLLAFSESKGKALKERISLYIKFNMKKHIPFAHLIAVGLEKQEEIDMTRNNDKFSNKQGDGALVVPSCSSQQQPQMCVGLSQRNSAVSAGDQQQEGIKTQNVFYQQCLIEEYQFLEKQNEQEQLQETFRILGNLKKNDMSITSICRRYVCELEQRLKECEEINESVGFLLKGIIAFKSDFKKRPDNPTIEDLSMLAKNSAALVQILKGTKENLTNVSLVWIVPNACDSLVNSLTSKQSPNTGNVFQYIESKIQTKQLNS